MKSLYIGLMSGTSADGVDAVLAEISMPFQFRVLDTFATPYPEHFRKHLLELALSEQVSKQALGETGFYLAGYFSTAARHLIKQNKLQAAQITAIGSHGHTIDHAPNSQTPYTTQIGNHARVAELTGITCIADFRSRDIAAGGQGAPLVPAFHQWIFQSAPAHSAIVNIGGISNITVLNQQNKACAGYDCGPGNCLLDSWHQQHTDEPFDSEGLSALQGNLLPNLLAKMVADPYFVKPAPKSTGREYFNMTWLQHYLKKCPETADWKSISRTLTELTARCIISEAVRHKCRHLFLCGGGVHNTLLRERLTSLAEAEGIQTALTSELGLSGDWVEASAFAWLAHQTVNKLTGNLPAVTGAIGDRILGAVYPA
ncbi:anhydro-N-acetylmuramic acid kinase [Oceanospirillum sediminis]|uniref:Anhydro-N-acetylmuramic acid kinase n=1 Tax=Oceanospirillum sediminis TaxID=2760088 RepID=A0A839IRF2_9GAMM|nr:anhydro-N-acetylmuramic acid kinase [Oceanospirillum sediminis]MBB1488063.1 anhydro-N-acetylmuramic acid kinase [Oceanospirillum sediminis]